MGTQETINMYINNNNGTKIEAKRGRGRPRPDYTVDRDQDVLRFLTQKGREELFDWTVKDIAHELDLLEKEVYASLLRLSWGNGTKANPGIPYICKTSRTTYRSMVYDGVVQERSITNDDDRNNGAHTFEPTTSDTDTTTAKWL
jgi:hypothetical protein